MSATPILTPLADATVLGYPRIGRRRELKRALEEHWAGRLDGAELEARGAQLRAASLRRMAELGLTEVPLTFSWYDHVLDAAVLVGATPQRFRALTGGDGTDLRTYFAMARGEGDLSPLELTKWFDTNYHYLVPEIGPDTPLALTGDAPIAHQREAAALGVQARPVLLGPVSLLLLAKRAPGSPAGFRPLDRLDDLLAVYASLLARLAAAGAQWVQLDEPALVADRSHDELAAARDAYTRLGYAIQRPAMLVAGYFGALGSALPILASTPIEAIAVDLVEGDRPGVLGAVPQLATKTLVAGVVDGRNVWRADLAAALDTLEGLRSIAGAVVPSSSCSLMLVPHDVDDEPAEGGALDPRVRPWLAFADQKVTEVVTLGRALREGRDAVAEALVASDAVVGDRRAADLVNTKVRARLDAMDEGDLQRGDYATRKAAQAVLSLPPLPTTTIGSFPQTDEIRAARAAYRAGNSDRTRYEERMRDEIERVIRLQEKLGLDVLVHGEPERNDMVQFFAEQLEGFTTTDLGWVQSYGSRCTRPPILYGDVARTAAMTVEWTTYAQSLTDRPVKGMLTGPVTMLAWSFVRDDQPMADSAAQVALAIRDEVVALEAAGIGIIQVDEPALRELLPPRAADQPAYLEWAVGAFRLATTGARDATQLHTHLCYSEFGEVVAAIDALDADVTSIEAARSAMEIVPAIAAEGFERGIGPGVYDIHSPRVPAVEEVVGLLRTALAAIPAERLWVNPDCGLKTRTYDELEPSLTNVVEAARVVRKDL